MRPVRRAISSTAEVSPRFRFIHFLRKNHTLLHRPPMQTSCDKRATLRRKSGCEVLSSSSSTGVRGSQTQLKCLRGAFPLTPFFERPVVPAAFGFAFDSIGHIPTYVDTLRSPMLRTGWRPAGGVERIGRSKKRGHRPGTSDCGYLPSPIFLSAEHNGRS